GLGSRFAAAGLFVMICVFEVSVPDCLLIHVTWSAMAMGIAALGPCRLSLVYLLGDRAPRS
ncbi:hypothetical protein AAHH78_36630, partial [Burkholderia pseudomallei]